jgi:hypothetical protein
MSYTSIYHHCITGLYDGSQYALTDSYPVSANHAIYMANNLQHLYDESTQYRVNWVAASTAGARQKVGTVTNVYEHIATYTFPLSPNYDGKATSLVVRVAAAQATESVLTGHFAVTFGPASTNPTLGDFAMSPAVLTGSTTSTTGEWVIQSAVPELCGDSGAVLFAQSFYDRSTVFSPAYTEENGKDYSAAMHMIRMSIWGYIEDYVAGLMAVVGVSAREFR